ncbi:MAG: sigma-70 family RNA polymerase sigma factor [Planctomycetota bacterium]
MADSVDDCLLGRAAGGDEKAFEELFARYRQYLSRFIQRRMDRSLRRRAGASDVLQETEWEAYRRLRDYLDRRPMRIRFWLRKIAQERLLNLREKHVSAARRAVARELPLPDRSSVTLAKRLVDRAPSPSEQLIRGEREVAVAGAITSLSEADRDILLMRNTEGLSYDEAADVLGITAAAARKRYGRALLRLQKVLERSGLGECLP